MTRPNACGAGEPRKQPDAGKVFRALYFTGRR
nr:MAG TPA: hypothetical protein [Caudoviricetes sp.]